MALFWRNWQRLEKRRRFHGGEIRTLRGPLKPSGTDPRVDAVIHYLPPEDGMSELEVYDYLANERLRDRLTQTFLEMNVERRAFERGVGIDGEPIPASRLCLRGGGACSCLAVRDSRIRDCGRHGAARRPATLEWVRGYAVLKELGQQRLQKANSSGDDFQVVFEEADLLDILERCGLERSVAARFVDQTLLHRSSRDMFDCPLIRLQDGKLLLFAPAVIDSNIAMAVLSNLSNRSQQLSRKGKAFEAHIREVFRRNNISAFAFTARRRGGEPHEYDAVVVWDDIIFVFECKNRSLSGNDAVQAYYFDLDVQGQARQAARLADALQRYPDIVAKELGAEHAGKKIVACVLHSLPYSRLEPINGVYFTDASS